MNKKGVAIFMVVLWGVCTAIAGGAALYTVKAAKGDLKPLGAQSTARTDHDMGSWSLAGN